MSKLPNAPLIEVIFEIRWQITNQNDIVEFQYLHGDLYSQLKKDFPIRENLLPPEMPIDALRGVPVFRFRKEKNGYPLYQLGPGLLTINITDDNYYWDKFEKQINDILDSFVNVYPRSSKLKFIPSLAYVDFFELNTPPNNPLDFINQNLNIKIEQSFINEPLENKGLNFLLNYKMEQDLLSLDIKSGQYNKIPGLVLQSKFIGENNVYSRESLTNWINHSHKILSEVFKNIIKEDLYKTFKPQ